MQEIAYRDCLFSRPILCQIGVMSKVMTKFQKPVFSFIVIDMKVRNDIIFWVRRERRLYILGDFISQPFGNVGINIRR